MERLTIYLDEGVPDEKRVIDFVRNSSRRKPELLRTMLIMAVDAMTGQAHSENTGTPIESRQKD